MKHLQQDLNTENDSFSYTVSGETAPTYVVDSNGYLNEKGKEIGKFALRDNQWHLHIGDNIIDSGPKNGLFYLPEFGLRSLTKLINQ